MSSKVFLWNFKEAWQHLSNQLGLIPMYHEDPTSEVWINQEIRNEPYHVSLGKELDVTWLSSYFLELDLFGEKKPLLILEAQNIDESALSFLVNKENIVSNRCVMSFTDLPRKFSNLKKHESYMIVQKIPFWDKLKASRFFESKFDLALNAPFREALLENTDGSYYDISQKIYWLSLFNEEEKKKLDLDEDSIGIGHIDPFRFTESINNREIKVFWSMISDLSSKDVEKLLPFIYSHLYKMSDSSLIEKKAKKSKYDQKILQASRQWKMGDIIALMKKIANFHKGTRLKKDLVLSEIQNHIIKSL